MSLAGTGNAVAPRLDRARRRAGLVLWIEQLWPALLPSMLLLGGYALCALLTLPQRLPNWCRVLLLLAVLGAAWRVAQGRVRRLRPPSGAARDRRIERHRGLPHRPLSTLADRPAAVAAGATEALWRAHLSRTAAGLGPLGAGLPFGRQRERGAADASLPAALLAAALLLAAVLSGADAPLRLASGFWPGIALPLGPRPSLQAWITPPPYAGGAPVFLFDPHGRFTVPEGARLSISLTGSAAGPRLSGLAGGGFTRLSERSWTLALPLAATGADGARLRVIEGGYRLADWRLVVQPAPAPTVGWTAPPGADRSLPWRSSLPWSVAERYGVRALEAEIRLADGGGARVLRVPIPLPGVPAQARGVATPDLSADPWAGAAVTARLLATDSGGRTATSPTARFTLPQRRFRNPLARAVLDLRRRLATGAETADAAAGDLEALGDTPGPFAQDSGLFLNLSATASLLRRPAGNGAAANRDAEAVDRLWSLALALEDGLHDRATGRANAELRRAQDRVEAQIEHMRQLGPQGQTDADRDELGRRIAALSRAIAARAQAMAAEAAREHRAMPPLPDAMAQGGQTLQRMLEQMRQAGSSQPEQAEQALSRMQAMLDHMRLATPQDLENAARQAQNSAEAREQMRAVQDLAQRQTALLDRSEARQSAADRARDQQGRTLQDGGEDQSGGQNDGTPDDATRALLQQLGIPLPDDAAAPQQGPAAPAPIPAPATPDPKQADARNRDRHDQTVLARALDELNREFSDLTGGKADSLGSAAEAMRAARDALGDGRDADAAAAQARALQALQKGQNQMQTAMRGGAGGDGGLALLPGGGGAQPGEDGDDADAPDGTPDGNAQLGSDQGGPRDPLGRPVGEGNGSSSGDGSETRLPGIDQSARSRQIERELRRRDSDRTRPQPELDYLDRLLKPF